jgi:hypothetical protein
MSIIEFINSLPISDIDKIDLAQFHRENVAFNELSDVLFKEENVMDRCFDKGVTHETQTVQVEGRWVKQTILDITKDDKWILGSAETRKFMRRLKDLQFFSSRLDNVKHKMDGIFSKLAAKNDPIFRDGILPNLRRIYDQDARTHARISSKFWYYKYKIYFK